MDGRNGHAAGRALGASSFIIGLDLGQAQDYTALTVTERKTVSTGLFTATAEQRIVQYTSGQVDVEPVMREKITHRYDVRHIQRFPLKTPYPQIVTQVRGLLDLLPATSHPRLAIDYTGVGRAVVDLFVASGLKVPLTAVTITGTGAANRDPDRPSYWHVPKKDLVGVLQVLLQNDALKFAKGLAHLHLLTEEMQKFRMKITPAANVTYEAWREGDHDDLVLSLALACWAGERVGGGGLR